MPDFYPEHLVENAEEENFASIRDEAVNDIASLIDVESNALEGIPVQVEDQGTTGGAEYEDNEITVDLSPDLSGEPDWVTEAAIQAEGIYEEVNHIAAEKVFETERGHRRKDRDEWSYWDNAANEVAGTLYKWEDDWSFKRPLQKADKRLSNASERLEAGLSQIAQDFEDRDLSESDNLREYCNRQAEIEHALMNDIVHFTGYRVSQEASEKDYNPSEVARMSYDEIREEFNEEVQNVKNELAEEYGIMIDLDGKIRDDEGFNFFVQTGKDEYKSRGVLEGYEENGRQFYTWDLSREGEQLPERVKA